MKRILFAVTVTLITAFFSGCLSERVGTATISVKRSELAKACKGEIGWADVSIVAYKDLSVSNVEDGDRKEEALASMREGLSSLKKISDVVPCFFCKDEEVKLKCFLDGEDAVVRLQAKLKVPIAYTNVLQEADLPRVMQFAVDKNGGKISMFESSANKRYGIYAVEAVFLIGYAVAFSDKSPVPADEWGKIASNEEKAFDKIKEMCLKQAQYYIESLLPVFMSLQSIEAILYCNVEEDKDVGSGVTLKVNRANDGTFSGLNIVSPEGFEDKKP